MKNAIENLIHDYEDAAQIVKNCINDRSKSCFLTTALDSWNRTNDMIRGALYVAEKSGAITIDEFHNYYKRLDVIRERV